MKQEINYAETLANRAEECRAIANQIKDEELRADYLRLAESYAALSKNEEAVARSRELLLRSTPDVYLGRHNQLDGPHEYQVYILFEDDHIKSRKDFVCEDDEAARERARQMADGYAVELWRGTRKLAKFAPGK